MRRLIPIALLVLFGLVAYEAPLIAQSLWPAGNVVFDDAERLQQKWDDCTPDTGNCDLALGGPGGSPGGTPGQVQVNSAGAFGGISEGTPGQVLTSTGPGTAPTFQDAPGGPGGSPGGTEGQVQVNSAGDFAGISEGALGEVLTSLGAGNAPTFAPAPVTPPGGSSGQLQLNSAGSFDGLAEGLADQVLTSNGAGVPPSFADAPETSPAGTTGQVQVNTAGSFGAVAEGTSGHVLTSNGAAAAPSFAPAPLTPPGGSVGQVQWNAGGSFSAIEEGTADQVLTSNGPGLAPQFKDAPGSGGTPGGSFDELQYNAAGSFGGVTNGAEGTILTAHASGAPSFADTLNLPAQPTEGGRVCLKESQASGTDDWCLAVPAGGLTSAVVCELNSSGQIPAGCIEAGTPFTGTLREYFGAWALNPDGTNCAVPAETEMVASGPTAGTIVCTDAPGGTIEGNLRLTGNYGGGGLEARLEAHGPSPGVLQFDFSVQCVSAGQAVAASWGAARAVSVTFGAANRIQHGTTATKADQTCAAGDTVFWRLALDSVDTTVADARVIGVEVAYTIDSYDE